MQPRLYPASNWASSLAAVSLLALTACSSDPSSGTTGPTRCPSGTILNDGECVPRTPSRDTGGPAPDAAGESDIASPDEDVADGGGDDVATPDVTPETDTGGGTTCVADAVRCSPAGIPQRCEAGVFVDAGVCGGNEICLAGRCAQGSGCTPGEIIGCASTTELLQCDDAGNRFGPVACDEMPYCYEGACGLRFCGVDETRCGDDGFTIEVCGSNGASWVEQEVCSIREGRACAGGECVSGCIAAAKDPSYIGCEYWSVDLPQYDDPFTAGPNQPHAVVISNVSDLTTTITIESFEPGIPAPPPVDVAPGESRAIEFPVNNVAESRRSLRSFKVMTTEPIVAYQFNPFNNVNLASNDGSLLLPVSAIGREYYVMSWTASAIQPAFFTVVGTSEDVTSVTIRFSSDIVDGPSTPDGIRGIRAGETRTFQIRQGEVLNFENKSEVRFTFPPPQPSDFTGTHIVADRPIVVFGGHSQAVIAQPDSEDSCCADHLEQQLFPVESWGTRYLAVKAPPRGTEPDVWRIMAQQPNTRIVTNPSIPGLDNEVIGPGEFVQAFTSESFEIETTAPVLVGQFLLSQQADGITRTVGDPAFILGVPVERFREDYQILTPERYSEDYVTILRPVGVPVSLDGNPLPDASFQLFGTRNWEYAHIDVEPGTHYIEATEPVGVMMFGYANAVSYGLPGGLNLVGSETP